MGVICQILIKKPREGVHRPGEQVTGKVKYIVDEPTEYQDVTLSFLGKGKCMWTERHGKSSTTYVGREQYVTTHVNVLNKQENETVTLEGEYEHPFEFYLPEDIPPSFKDKYCNIRYRIILKFVKASFFSFNKKFDAEIPVYGFVDPTPTDGPVVFGLEKSLFTLFATKIPVVNLKAEIAKAWLSPGENAHLTYTVTNDTDVVIPAVRTELYSYVTYTSESGRTKRICDRVKLPEYESPSIAENEVGKFSCTFPTLPELYSMQHSKLVSKEYKVRVTVRLPLPHINASVEMPIVVGERKGRVLEIEAMGDPDDQPPSYWEAMCEKRKK